MVNAFIKFVQEYRAKNPSLSYKDAMKEAAKVYKKDNKQQDEKTDKPKSKAKSTPKPKKKKEEQPKEEEKMSKATRGKVLRMYKKLLTKVQSGLRSGKLEEKEYGEWRKNANILRGNSKTNQYAKKLREVEKKFKSKLYAKLKSKAEKEKVKITTRDDKVARDLKKEELNREKAKAKRQKEVRMENRRRNLENMRNVDGTKKYTAKQIDDLLKIEESGRSAGLSRDTIKDATSAIGIYLKEDYEKEFLRLNPSIPKTRGLKYLKDQKFYQKDPRTIPIITDPAILLKLQKKPKAPVAPTVRVITPKPKTLRGINLRYYQDIRKIFPNDFDFKTPYIDFYDKNDEYRTSKKVEKLSSKVDRVDTNTDDVDIKSRLTQIKLYLDNYENAIDGIKLQIKSEKKKTKKQAEDLLKTIADSSDTGGLANLKDRIEDIDDKADKSGRAKEAEKKMLEALRKTLIAKRPKRKAKIEGMTFKEATEEFDRILKKEEDERNKKEEVERKKKEAEEKKRLKKEEAERKKAEAEAKKKKKKEETEAKKKKKDTPKPPPPKPAPKPTPTAITQSEIDSMKKDGALAREYTRSFGSLKDNQILDLVEQDEIDKNVSGAKKTKMKDTNPNFKASPTPPPTPTPTAKKLTKMEVKEIQKKIRTIEADINYGDVFTHLLEIGAKQQLKIPLDMMDTQKLQLVNNLETFFKSITFDVELETTTNSAIVMIDGGSDSQERKNSEKLDLVMDDANFVRFIHETTLNFLEKSKPTEVAEIRKLYSDITGGEPKVAGRGFANEIKRKVIGYHLRKLAKHHLGNKQEKAKEVLENINQFVEKHLPNNSLKENLKIALNKISDLIN